MASRDGTRRWWTQYWVQARHKLLEDAAREKNVQNFVNCLQIGEVPNDRDPQKGSRQAKGDYRDASVTVLEARPGKNENLIRVYY